MASNSHPIGIMLLLKMLQEEVPLSFLNECGVIPATMFQPVELKLYYFISNFVKQNKKLPSLPMVVNQPDFASLRNLRLTSDPVTAFASMLLQRSVAKVCHNLRADMDDLLLSGSQEDMADAIIDSAKQLTALKAGSLSSTGGTVMPITTAMRSAVDLHNRRRDAAGIEGLALGLPFIDYVTDGTRKGDLSALVARPGMGKTYFALKSGMHSWLVNRQPGVIFSFEMPAAQLGRRCIGIGMQMATDIIKKGRMSFMKLREVNKWITVMEGLHTDVPLYIVQGSMDTSLAFVSDILYEHNPDWGLVDAAYLMRARKARGQVSRTDNIADGAEGLRSLALETDTAIMATYQYNRNGAGNLANIMYSDAIGQVAALVFDIQEDKKKAARWAGTASRVLSIIKGRDGEQGSVRVLFDPKRSAIYQAEVLFSKDTGMSKAELADLSSGYADYLASSGDADAMIQMEQDSEGAFSFVPSRSSM